MTWADMIEHFKWLFVVAGGWLVWLVRLEAKQASNTRDIARLERSIEIERIESREALREIQSDVKTLLQRTAK